MKFLTAISLIAFLAVTPIWAQSGQDTDSTRHQKTAPPKVLKRPVRISGEVGSDGTTFTADSDHKIWQLSNPDGLQSIYGHPVTMRGAVNPERNAIQVLSVKAVAYEHSGIKLDDAALRR